MYEQQYAMTALLIMSVMNVILGILMVAEIVPLYYGLGIATFGMAGIIWKVKKDLMGDVRLWETPKQYRERKNNELS
jgi:hypothetical protein